MNINSISSNQASYYSRLTSIAGKLGSRVISPVKSIATQTHQVYQSLYHGKLYF
jgi:hypothetical protein